jgi:hypothetical protein
MDDSPKPYVLPEEEQYFGELHDELDGTQVEATLDLSELTDAETVQQGLLQHFSGDGAELQAFVPHAMSTTQEVDKYFSPEGSFSVVHLADGTAVLKEKSDRKHHKGGVSTAREQRRQLEQGDNPVAIAALERDIDGRDIRYLGRLERDKSRIALENRRTRRVYVVTVDISCLEVDASGAPVRRGVRPTRKQLAIEYKGTVAGDTTAAASDGTGAKPAHVRKHVEKDVRTIEKQVRQYLACIGIDARVAAESKTRWAQGLAGSEPGLG